MPQDVIGVSLLVEIAIEPRSRDGHEKLRIALARLTEPVTVRGSANGGFPLVPATTLVMGWSTRIA